LVSKYGKTLGVARRTYYLATRKLKEVLITDGVALPNQIEDEWRDLRNLNLRD
jgi:hypothetical protein